MGQKIACYHVTISQNAYRKLCACLRVSSVDKQCDCDAHFLSLRRCDICISSNLARLLDTVSKFALFSVSGLNDGHMGPAVKHHLCETRLSRRL